MDDKDFIHHELRTAIRTQRIPYVSIATAIDASESMVTSFMQGVRNLSYSKLVKLADFLDLDCRMILLRRHHANQKAETDQV